MEFWLKFKNWIKKLLIFKKKEFFIKIPVSESSLKLYNETTIAVERYTRDIEHLHRLNMSLEKLEGVLSPEDMQSFKILIDLRSLVLISLSDLAMISRSAFISRTSIGQAFYIKHAYLLIHEFIIRFDQERGLTLRKLILENFREMEIEYKQALKLLSTFKKTWKYEGEMKTVRDNVSGHIVGDFALWYSIISSFDTMKCGKMLLDFGEVQNGFLLIYHKLLELHQERIEEKANFTKMSLNNMIGDIERMTAVLNEKSGGDEKLSADFSEIRKLANL